MFMFTIALLSAINGIEPLEMADIVADRLARLDKLCATVEVRVYTVPLSASPLNRLGWGEAIEPGDGGCRAIQLVRPHMLEHSSPLSGTGNTVVSGYTPGRAVRKAVGVDRQGKNLYIIAEDAASSVNNTAVPVMQLFDLQMHQSLVPGTNIETLLRNHSAQLVSSEGDLYTYFVALHVDGFTNSVSESYELSLNSRGTPIRCRFTMQVADGNDFVFESDFSTVSTIELNGAELVSEAIVSTRNSVVPHYAVYDLVARSAIIAEAMSVDAVQLEPETRNSRIYATRANGVEEELVYDDDGAIIATTTPQCDPAINWAPLSIAGFCAAVTATAVTLYSKLRHS